LTGANFSPLGNILDPMADISTSPVVLLDGTTLMTTFTIGSNATLGDRTVRVTSNGLLSGTVTFSIVQSKKRRGQLTTVP
jgi:hypothetical protein